MNPPIQKNELTGKESDSELTEKLKRLESDLIDTKKIIYQPSILGILGFILLFAMLGCMLGLAIQFYLNTAPVTVAIFAVGIFTLGGGIVGLIIAIWRVLTEGNSINSENEKQRQLLDSQIHKIRQEIDRRTES